MEDFSNSIILPENLPELKEETFNPVDRKYLRLMYYRIFIAAFFFIAAGIGIFFIDKEEISNTFFWIYGASFLAVLLYSALIFTLAFPYRGYLIREKDFAYKKGLIRFSLTSIPYKRIQHVELSQGLLAKKMGLASIKVFTAGGSSDDLSIPGLPTETAHEIRSYLTDLISSDESV